MRWENTSVFPSEPSICKLHNKRIKPFAHWHAACYDETLNKEEKQKQIASEVTEFLSDLFTDKIVMWGSHKNGGGFYYPEFNENEQDAPLEPNEVNKYVWSGKKIS